MIAEEGSEVKMKQLIASLLIVGAATAWAVAGSGNTIILSGWPPAETCQTATGGVVTVEACSPAVATSTLTTVDGRAASVAESGASSFSSCKRGSMLILR